jgi:hypothetical protein
MGHLHGQCEPETLAEKHAAHPLRLSRKPAASIIWAARIQLHHRAPSLGCTEKCGTSTMKSSYSAIARLGQAKLSEQVAVPRSRCQAASHNRTSRHPIDTTS